MEYNKKLITERVISSKWTVKQANKLLHVEVYVQELIKSWDDSTNNFRLHLCMKMKRLKDSK